MSKYECDDCGLIMTEDDLGEVKHLSQRVDEGGPMPSGECPECGALCYRIPDPPATVRLRFPHRDGMLMAVHHLVNVLSAPFSVTPYPDDVWVIEIKAETAPHMAGYGERE